MHINTMETLEEDFILPEIDSVEECGCFEDELPVVQPAPIPRGIFSETPERAARWIEEASLHFSR